MIKKKEEKADISFDNNHSIITKEDVVKETEETIINNEEEEKQEIRSENIDPKPLEKEEKLETSAKENEPKPQENKSYVETKKEEKKTVQIQSEMSGLDEKISKDSDDEKEGKEDLEIPSFLRNQSN